MALLAFPDVGHSLSFGQGCILREDWLVVTATRSDLAESMDHHFLLYWLDGSWYHEFVEGTYVRRLFVREQPDRLLAALTADGSVRITTDDGVTVERIDPSAVLTDLRGIDAKLYGCGMERRVYRRDGLDEWLPIDEGVRTDPPYGFRSIDGFSGDELYAAGFAGDLWRCDRGRWTKIDLPTTMILETVTCGADGLVYVAGARGVLARGRGDEWELVAHGITTDMFWSSAAFRDRVYLVTSKGLFAADGHGLSRVEMRLDTPARLGHVSVCADWMLLTGEDDLIIGDGHGWRRLPHPDSSSRGRAGEAGGNATGRGAS